jgi:16S rRNA G966 N2-methylase RsmD
LIVDNLPGTLRAHGQLRAANPGRFSDSDLYKIVLGAVLKINPFRAPSATEIRRLCIEQHHSIEDLKADSFDIVFVDPPFDSNLGGLVLERLDRNACVRHGGFVYVESPASTQIPPPDRWSVWRDQQMGEVRMQLFRRKNPDE